MEEVIIILAIVQLEGIEVVDETHKLHLRIANWNVKVALLTIMVETLRDLSIHLMMISQTLEFIV